MSFQLAHLNGARVPRVVNLPVAAGAEFELGALLVRDSNGAFAECAADPAAVATVAESAYGPDTGIGSAQIGWKGFPPGYMQGTSVADEVKFSALYTGTLPAAAGGSYGVVRGTDGRWRVDFTDTTNVVVKLLSLEWTRAPLNKNRVIVTFLPDVVQLV